MPDEELQSNEAEIIDDDTYVSFVDDEEATDNDWGTLESDVKIFPKIGEMYLLLMNEDEIFSGTITSTNEDNIIITSADDKSLVFNLNQDELVLKTENYEILDIVLVDIIDPEDISKEKVDIDDDLTVLLSDVDKQNRVYSISELKEQLISDLLEKYETDDIDKIVQIVEDLVNLINHKSYISYDLPDSIIPIIKQSINSDPLETKLKDFIKDDFSTETKNNVYSYQHIIKTVMGEFNPYDMTDDIERGFHYDNYTGQMFLDCMQDTSCLGMNGLYSFDERKNNNGLTIPTKYDNQSGNSIFVKLINPDKINIVGFLSLISRYQSFSLRNLLYNKISVYMRKVYFKNL